MVKDHFQTQTYLLQTQTAQGDEIFCDSWFNFFIFFSA